MIESARYVESGAIVAVIDGVQMTVPDDMANRHRRLLAEWEADGNAIEPHVVPPPTVYDLLTYLADKRWQVETGGCPFDGTVIKTDRESQVKLTAAWTRAKADPMFSIPNWKIAPGVFIALDNAAILAIGDAATAHVQACFDTEEALTAEILAGTITTYAEIDAAAWPPNS